MGQRAWRGGVLAGTHFTDPLAQTLEPPVAPTGIVPGAVEDAIDGVVHLSEQPS